MTHAETLPAQGWNWKHLAALIAANVALALGAWWVRLADSGPVSAGFWRLTLPLPLLFLLAKTNRQPIVLPRRTMLIIALAGLAFGLDLASWHIGIGMTKLANATLFGNSGSLIVMIWGLIALKRKPRGAELLAVVSAFTGAAILFGRSLEVSTQTLVGDLLCLLAGLFYACYIIPLQQAREAAGNWSLLAWSSLAGAPLMLALAIAMGEPVWPQVWWPVVGLAITSQVIGQGLLVYALRHFQPLVIGLALLCQPAIGILAGWLTFGETMGLSDVLGMVLVAAALVIARVAERD